MIRTRAGQPNIAAGQSQAALRAAVRHERRIELAFENHRFWDVRRWVIGPWERGPPSPLRASPRCRRMAAPATAAVLVFVQVILFKKAKD